MVAVAEELSSRMVVSERKSWIRRHKAPADVISFDRRRYPALIKLPSQREIRIIQKQMQLSRLQRIGRARQDGSLS